MNIRKLALQAIEKILYKNGYANIIINEYLNKYELTDDERRLFTKLVIGTVEKKLTLAYYLEPFLKKKQKTSIYSLLLMSVYQLVYLNIPDYTVVNESVNIANTLDKMVGSFVNAVLRNFLRNELRSFEGLEDVKLLSVKYSYPTWLIAYLLKDYNYQTVVKILEFNDDVKHDAIRVNTLKATTEEVTEVLNDEKIPYQQSDLVNDGLIVEESMVNHELFKEGKITIQDIASQMVTEIANPEMDSTIIDLCSAPGGKAAHLAAWMNNTGTIYACDIYLHKIKLMEKNFKRLGVTNTQVELIDARKVKNVVKQESFDYVLADMPCSGLGVMSHKCDLKYNITYDSIKEIIALQKEILDASYPLIKKNGYLIVSTCTINKSENEEQIAWLIKKYPNLKVEYEKTILPYEYGTDGFFICKLKKEEKND
ncbi:MAG: 16S rRNA (cytosine(967)-C(5))-methyltransferase RsmB [Acholeplasmataceae bacterium]|nr:16S rRNA (cytosine(967)-C(5))-methyltransferase RsmB [Acholeplasmataceae bacterium]